MYKVEASLDGESFIIVIDRTENDNDFWVQPFECEVAAQLIIIMFIQTSFEMRTSIRFLQIFGEKIDFLSIDKIASTISYQDN